MASSCRVVLEASEELVSREERRVGPSSIRASSGSRAKERGEAEEGEWEEEEEGEEEL
jgi:hypothetical protein